jgi:hypothetical protein
VLPHEIDISGCVTGRDVVIAAPLGARKPRLLTIEGPPHFAAPPLGNEVTLRDVDLSACLLVGNPLGQMGLSNVEWPRLRGRFVLYDELVYRSHGAGPTENVREAYQILKEKYRGMGDHVRSGDFHYGEMEMRRREYGWPRRVLCVEFLYWALSGYGMGYVRAFGWLVGFLLASALVYRVTSPTAFPGGLEEALRFGLNVATFQRPEVPEELSVAGRWCHIVEVVLAPVLGALFVLALRMRLRR